MKPWWDNPEYHSATVDNKIAAWAEHCREIEQQLECVRDELMRVRAGSDIRTKSACVLPDHFFTMPHAAHTMMTSAELRSILLNNNGMVMAAGKLWEVRSKHLGVGVHRVWLALAEGFQDG
jgi:hypothetical protein